MPHAVEVTKPPKQKRLVLCFDGTAKKFAGNASDSNVVKIYQMLDRKAEDQFHYYQPGIGTYIQGDSSYGFWHDLRAGFSMILDQAFGMSFRHHVIAGYHFLMRHYSPGDYVYIFGFSRGAYTARFLAEMIQKIGLLSRGNDEMVAFVWKTFSDWQSSRSMTRKTQSDKNKEAEAYMESFRKTFCRDDVSVHFLGLFDCVNSVGQFDLPFSPSSFEQIPTKVANNIRHAVAINERRIKFKPALFHQDGHRLADSQLQEVWFAGAHGDIGGGWPLVGEHQTRTLSNLALKWMMDEVRDLPDANAALEFDPEWKPFLERQVDPYSTNLDDFVLKPDREGPPKFPEPHDELMFGRAKAGLTSYIATAFWKLIEYVPLFSRLEYTDDKWQLQRFPPSRGEYRDIPLETSVHPSVKLLYQEGSLHRDEVPPRVVKECDGSVTNGTHQPLLASRSKRTTRESVKSK